MGQKNNMALASMIIGILSIVLSCCCYLGVILGSLAVILAGLSRIDEKMTGQATAGMVTGIIGILFGVGSIFVWIALLNG